MTERTGAAAAGGAIEWHAQLDRMPLIIATPAGIDRTEQHDGGRAQGGGDVPRAAVAGDHKPTAANDGLRGSEADILTRQAADLRMVRGLFDSECCRALLR